MDVIQRALCSPDPSAPPRYLHRGYMTYRNFLGRLEVEKFRLSKSSARSSKHRKLQKSYVIADFVLDSAFSAAFLFFFLELVWT